MAKRKKVGHRMVIRAKDCAMVFLSIDPYSWIKPKGARRKVIFEINVDYLPEKFTHFVPQLDEINYWGDIPPDRIKVFKIIK